MNYIHELFEAQVAKKPDTAAVVFEGSTLTYRELDRRTDELAHRLRDLGVGPNTLVALFLERSLDMVVGMLGVLKAGGAYVPLDPTLPPKRLAYILVNSQPRVLVTQDRLRMNLPPHGGPVVVIDNAAASIAEPVSAPVSERTPTPHDLAYVIYTSGSTGEPKGVEIEHGAVVNMLGSMEKRPGLRAEDSVLAITTMAFDIAVLEIFLPLVCGARVVIAPSSTVADGTALARLIETSGVSVLQATPATLRMLLDAGWAGAPHLKILCGGEAWTPELAKQVLPRCNSLWNMYGPTETTVWSAVAKVESDRPVVIGLPIANTRFYVLDGTRQLLPVGVAGELYIAGKGLARGYLGRPQLTAERFLADPFWPEPGAKMYRTGDSVRRLPDGTLEFLGRLDHQVKIRGYRVELGEIEAVLGRQPGVEQCVVVAQKDVHGDPRLVAYIVPSAGSVVSSAELRPRLSELLPAYMVPAMFVPITAFPLTPSGKLDRKALPAPDELLAEKTDAVRLQPRTPTEKILAEIWCEFLNRKQVDIHENFFDLGGHSLLAVRVVGKINTTLNVHLNMPLFFLNATIARLASVLEQNRHIHPESRITKLRSGNGVPLYLMGARPDEYRIAELIGGDRPIFAMSVPMPPQWAEVEGTEVSLPTIEELGELYGEVLRGHAGSSPCGIIGYSLGGKIAFEAARALHRSGGNVAFVMLVDAWAITWTKTTRWFVETSLRWIWRGVVGRPIGVSRIQALRLSLGHYWRLAGWLLARIPGIVKSRPGHTQSRLVAANEGSPPSSHPSGYFDKNGMSIDYSVIHRLTYEAGRRWHPQPLDAQGVLIRARLLDDEEGLPGYDFTNGWGPLFIQGVEVVQATGDHISMLTDAHSQTLLSLITSAVDRYTSIHRTDTEQIEMCP